MALATTANLVDAVRRLGLLEPTQLNELARWQSRFAEPRLLAQQLLQRGWLTAFQVEQLLAGRGAELVLGPYRLLTRLGEGGNSTVFQARHQDQQRVVALKVLRPELVADKEAVGRFYREMEVARQINHPHIVAAYDVGRIGATLFLALEFVDGVNLERRVQDAGPLPVVQAVDFLRQAALGLRHAHERGLVHRDVKPANLLLGTKDKVPGTKEDTAATFVLRPSSAGLVKVLDLGLARLLQPAAGSPTGNLTILSGTEMTQGTPDFMAPEQALDFHSADARSDIYSLGCTFYFLLTGRPPFAGGSLAEVLVKHQREEPAAVESLRKDLPVEVPALLRKMLAKRPRDRYPDLGPVVEELTALHARLGAGTPPPARPTVRMQSPAPNERRLRLLAGSAIGLAAIIVGIIPLWFGLRSNRPEETRASQTTVSSVGKEPPSVPSELVTISAVSTNKPYTTTTARVGVTYWIDRAYQLTALSAALDGATLIRAANEDKNVSSSTYLTLTLSAPATMYIAYDKRMKRLPGWLSDESWKLTSEVLSASGGDVQASPMKVYARRFPAGTVTLGGNRESPAAGAGSNYVVLVRPLP